MDNTTSSPAVGQPAGQIPRPLSEILPHLAQAKTVMADLAARRAALATDETAAAQVAQALFVEYQSALELARTATASLSETIRSDLTAAKQWLETL